MNFVSLEFAAFLAVVYDRLARAEEPVVRILFPPAERWYGAGGEGDGTIVAGK